MAYISDDTKAKAAYLYGTKGYTQEEVARQLGGGLKQTDVSNMLRDSGLTGRGNRIGGWGQKGRNSSKYNQSMAVYERYYATRRSGETWEEWLRRTDEGEVTGSYVEQIVPKVDHNTYVERAWNTKPRERQREKPKPRTTTTGDNPAGARGYTSGVEQSDSGVGAVGCGIVLLLVLAFFGWRWLSGAVSNGIQGVKNNLGVAAESVVYESCDDRDKDMRELFRQVTDDKNGKKKVQMAEFKNLKSQEFDGHIAPMVKNYSYGGAVDFSANRVVFGVDYKNAPMNGTMEADFRGGTSYFYAKDFSGEANRGMIAYNKDWVAIGQMSKGTNGPTGEVWVSVKEVPQILYRAVLADGEVQDILCRIELQTGECFAGGDSSEPYDYRQLLYGETLDEYGLSDDGTPWMTGHFLPGEERYAWAINSLGYIIATRGSDVVDHQQMVVTAGDHGPQMIYIVSLAERERDLEYKLDLQQNSDESFIGMEIHEYYFREKDNTAHEVEYGWYPG